MKGQGKILFLFADDNSHMTTKMVRGDAYELMRLNLMLCLTFLKKRKEFRKTVEKAKGGILFYFLLSSFVYLAEPKTNFSSPLQLVSFSLHFSHASMLPFLVFSSFLGFVPFFFLFLSFLLPYFRFLRILRSFFLGLSIFPFLL